MTAPWTRMPVLAGLACILLLGGMPRRLPAADVDPNEVTAVTTLVNEVISKLAERSYQQVTVAQLYHRAMVGMALQAGDADPAYAKDLSSLPDAEAEAAFMEAMKKMASTPGQRRTLRELVERGIQICCRQHDPYTRYIRAEDEQQVALMTAGAGAASSIGMTLQEKDGVFSCFPQPGTPAEQAGIQPGDRLLSVDGKPVEGKIQEFVAVLFRGAPGTTVSLRVERGFGRAQTVNITRDALNLSPLNVEQTVTGLRLQVRRFNETLVADARKALGALTPGDRITIDLRGCSGGELEAGIEFAGLFLEDGEPIVTILKRDQSKEEHAAKGPRAFKPASIAILQDEGTASAAELVIAALIHSPNTTAASQGKKTYGKGTVQSQMILRGGGKLIATTEVMVAPQGRSWDRTGLLPAKPNSKQIFPEGNPAPSPAPSR